MMTPSTPKMPNINQTLEHARYKLIQGLDFHLIKSEVRPLHMWAVILQTLQLKEPILHVDIC